VIDSAVTKRYIGLENYKSVLQNRFFNIAIKNTLAFLLTDVPVLLLLSLTLALFVFSSKIKNGIFQAALIMPILLPSAAITPIFEKISVYTNSQLSVHMLYVWKYLGLFMLIFLSARKAISTEYYDAAALDGANAVDMFKKITLPLILPTIGFAAIIGVVFNLRIFKEVYLMNGAYPDESVYLTQHYMNNQFNKLNYPLLTASGLVFALFLISLTAVVFVIVRRRRANE